VQIGGTIETVGSTGSGPTKKAKKEGIFEFLHKNSTNAKNIEHISYKTHVLKVETKVDGKYGVCYFVSDGTVKFRHEGRDGLAPPCFILENRLITRNHDKVLAGGILCQWWHRQDCGPCWKFCFSGVALDNYFVCPGTSRQL
jgi:hypothetical protein